MSSKTLWVCDGCGEKSEDAKGWMTFTYGTIRGGVWAELDFCQPCDTKARDSLSAALPNVDMSGYEP